MPTGCRAARGKIEAATANLGAQLIVSESTAQRQADEFQALRQQLEEQQFNSRSECQRYATENVVLQRRIEEQALAISGLEVQVAELSRQQHNNKGQDNNCVPQEQIEPEVQELKLQCSALHSALKSEEQQRQVAEEVSAHKSFTNHMPYARISTHSSGATAFHPFAQTL